MIVNIRLLTGSKIFGCSAAPLTLKRRKSINIRLLTSSHHIAAIVIVIVLIEVTQRHIHLLAVSLVKPVLRLRIKHTASHNIVVVATIISTSARGQSSTTHHASVVVTILARMLWLCVWVHVLERLGFFSCKKASKRGLGIKTKRDNDINA